MMSFHDCVFYFVMKRHSQFLGFFFKISEGSSQDVCSFRGMGRARVLMEAIEDFRRRERDQRSPSPLPMALRGRAGTSGMVRHIVEGCPGTVTTFNLRGRARGRGFPSYYPPCTDGRGRARTLALPPRPPSYNKGAQI